MIFLKNKHMIIQKKTQSKMYFWCTKGSFGCDLSHDKVASPGKIIFHQHGGNQRGSTVDKNFLVMCMYIYLTWKFSDFNFSTQTYQKMSYSELIGDNLHAYIFFISKGKYLDGHISCRMGQHSKGFSHAYFVCIIGADFLLEISYLLIAI